MSKMKIGHNNFTNDSFFGRITGLPRTWYITDHPEYRARKKKSCSFEKIALKNARRRQNGK